MYSACCWRVLIHVFLFFFVPFFLRYRWSWTEKNLLKTADKNALTKDHGGTAVTLAPVNHAMGEDVFSFSQRCSKL